MTNFEGKNSSNEIIINDEISADGVMASDVPPRYLLTQDFKILDLKILGFQDFKFKERVFGTACSIIRLKSMFSHIHDDSLPSTYN